MDSTQVCETTVGIIGSKGRMGAWLLRHLAQKGINVKGKDKCATDELADFAGSCDVIILAVPVTSFDEVTRVIGTKLTQNSLLIDIASLKEGPVEQMLKNTGCEVIGAHPMFGPSAQSFKNQICYICPARTDSWLPRIEGFLTKLGARICIMSPQDHDRLMATVQTLRHIIMTSMGLALKQANFSIHTDSDITGEWFNNLARMLIHQFDQPSELYADLALNNKHAIDILQQFRSLNNEVIEAISTGNKPALVGLMEMVRAYTRSG